MIKTWDQHIDSEDPSPEDIQSYMQEEIDDLRARIKELEHDGWVVVRQEAYRIRDDDFTQLGYIMPEGMIVFKTEDEVTDFMLSLDLPLGWVRMKVSQLLPFKQ